MEANSDFLESEFARFNSSKTILLQLVYKDSEDFRRTLSAALDDLNSVEYSLKIAPDEVHKFQNIFVSVKKHDSGCACLSNFPTSHIP